MPFAHAEDGARLYWRLDGGADLPALVLLNSIGVDMSLWDRCAARLVRHFRLLRIDARGHGASDAPDGDYDLPMLTRDVVAVMDHAGVDRAHVAGVSLGGMVAMQLALDHPDRLDRLALICTSATMDGAAWADRVDTVRRHGMAPIVDLAMSRFLSPAFLRGDAAAADSVRRGLETMAPAGYAGAAAAIRDMALVKRIGTIDAPTVVVAGDRDTSTPFEPHGAALVTGIPGAGIVHLDAGHLAPIEAPDALVAALLEFLTPSATDAAADALFEAGLLNRRRVLGDDWVDASLAARTAFNADFQAMITRIAWHEVWGRAGLDDRTRRLLVVAMTASLGRWEEFGLHVRTGLERSGFSVEELKEVLMQVAIYAGVPAANTAFAEAGRIIDAQRGRE